MKRPLTLITSAFILTVSLTACTPADLERAKSSDEVLSADQVFSKSFDKSQQEKGQKWEIVTNWTLKESKKKGRTDYSSPSKENHTKSVVELVQLGDHEQYVKVKKFASSQGDYLPSGLELYRIEDSFYIKDPASDQWMKAEIDNQLDVVDGKLFLQMNPINSKTLDNLQKNGEIFHLIEGVDQYSLSAEATDSAKGKKLLSFLLPEEQVKKAGEMDEIKVVYIIDKKTHQIIESTLKIKTTKFLPEEGDVKLSLDMVANFKGEIDELPGFPGEKNKTEDESETDEESAEEKQAEEATDEENEPDEEQDTLKELSEKAVINTMIK